MVSLFRTAVGPLYLLACLLLGGSAQGAWHNAVLQLAGLLIIAWVAAEPREEDIPAVAKPVLILAIAAIALTALQLLPVPPSFWAHGSRNPVAAGFLLLGRPLPFLPLSLTPYASLSTLFGVIPPLAMFCAMVGAKAYRPSWLVVALLAGALAGTLLGALQVGGAGADSPWYLYPETNLGSGVGFFANANHMASLLVIALPFAAAAAASGKSRNIQHYSALLSVLAGVALVLVVGIVLNGSLAGYALAVPTIAASAMIVLRAGKRTRRALGLLAAISVLVSLAALGSSSIGATKIGQDATTSVQSRQEILQTTGKAIRDNMPWGTGLGSFVQVYRLYESPDRVTSEYVIHAHNDYAELALETGAVGVVLLLVFLVWWAVAAWQPWRGPEGSPYARAASIASAAILIHSLVDFPLRTAAISTCFAMCLGLLADRRQPEREDASELRPSRHIVVR
jgi:O-antigen ligase